MSRVEISKDKLPTELEFEGYKLELLFFDDDKQVKNFIKKSKLKIEDFLMDHLLDDGKLYFYLIQLIPIESFVANRSFEYISVICSTKKLPFDKTVSFVHPELGKFTGKVKSMELNPTQELLNSEEIDEFSEEPEIFVNTFVSLVAEVLGLDIKTLMRKY